MKYIICNLFTLQCVFSFFSKRAKSIPRNYYFIGHSVSCYHCVNNYISASGLRFNVTSNQVVVDDSGTLTLICSVNESDVYSIFITRVLPPRYDKDEFVASFIFETAALGDQITDDKRLPGTEVKHGSVHMYRAKLTCSEAKRYRCFYTNSSSREREITLQVLGKF